jgi:hypothetical protein
MKNKTKTIIDIILIFVITGIGVALANFLLPSLNKLTGFLKIISMAFMQFLIAGFAMIMIMIFRNEKFKDYGLKKEKSIRSLILGAAFIIAYLSLYYLFKGYLDWSPFKQVLVMDNALNYFFPLNVLGVMIIALVWGFFEGFNFVYISKKINSLFRIRNPFLKPGPIIIVICNIIVHLSTGHGLGSSLSGSIPTYIVCLIPEITGNSWGSVLIFLLLWNAI